MCQQTQTKNKTTQNIVNEEIEEETINNMEN